MHGFFFSMGGFVSRAHGHPITTIAQLKEPIIGAQYESDITNTPGHEIADKSKGDALSKGIALLQGLWFILQILARFVQHLPVSELEIATLAFAVVNILTWLLWWHKPLDVQLPILVGPTTEVVSAATPDVAVSSTSQTSFPDDGNMHSAVPLLTGLADAHTPFEAFSLTPAVNRQRTRDIISNSVFHGAIRGNYAQQGTTAVPALWSSPEAPEHTPFAAMGVAIIFGGIHCFAWDASFPSTAEHLLWRVSAVGIVAYPVLILVQHLLIGLFHPGYGNVHKEISVPVAVLGIAIYAVFRVILLVPAFTTIRTLDAGWFVDVDWTVYIPLL
jgi:hypothetical protein